MPGVPSGRGCNGCRKQKKKCDELIPSCSRCTRLGLVCVGAGEKRFKFVEQQFSPRKSSTPPADQSLSRKSRSSSLDSVPNSPNDPLTSLRSAFISMVKPSTDLRYNLAWTYGSFLDDVPVRIGRNQALDAASWATVYAHSSYCAGLGVTYEGLSKYSEALRMLRLYLDDPVKAKTPETLCAVMLLLVSQSFMRLVEGGFTGHCEGMAQILKTRGAANTSDVFEMKLLMSMRGPVVFEALFNNKIQFTPQEWRDVVRNPFDGKSVTGKLMQCISMIPYFIATRISGRSPSREDTELLDEIRTNYEDWKKELKTLRDQVVKVDAKIVAQGLQDTWGPLIQAHAFLKRSYGIGLAIAIIINCVLSGADVNQSHLLSESTYFSEEILDLCESVNAYKPLGASYLPLCLSAAWVGTTDLSLRERARQGLEVYKGNLGIGVRGRVPEAMLEWTSRRLRLQNPDPLMMEKYSFHELE